MMSDEPFRLKMVTIPSFAMEIFFLGWTGRTLIDGLMTTLHKM